MSLMNHKLDPKQFVSWVEQKHLTGKNQYWINWVSDDPATTKTVAFDKLQHDLFFKELLVEAGYTEITS